MTGGKGLPSVTGSGDLRAGIVTVPAQSASPLLKPAEMAAQLRISEKQLADLVRDGEVGFVNVGRGKKKPRILFTQADRDEFIERRRARKSPPSCQSIGRKARRSISTTSGSEVVAFSALRSARASAKRKP